MICAARFWRRAVAIISEPTVIALIMPMKPATRITEAIITSTMVKARMRRRCWRAQGRLGRTGPNGEASRLIAAGNGCTGVVAEDQQLVRGVELREGDAEGVVDFIAFVGEAVVDQGARGLALRDAADVELHY